MFFTTLTAPKVKIVVLSAVIYAAVVALLAWPFPVNGASFQEAYLRWFFGIPLTILLWLFFEWFGEKALGLPFWSRMSSASRIVLLVFVLTAAAISAMVVGVWWQGKSAA